MHCFYCKNNCNKPTCADCHDLRYNLLPRISSCDLCKRNICLSCAIDIELASGANGDKQSSYWICSHCIQAIKNISV